jgi:hypothetical protein
MYCTVPIVLVNICIYGDKNTLGREYIGPAYIIGARNARSSGICARTQPSVSICAIRFFLFLMGASFYIHSHLHLHPMIFLPRDLPLMIRMPAFSGAQVQ